ncbi:MAG: branched-chain amino acid ABC transporter permease [Alphaproteobacteria bacterium]
MKVNLKGGFVAALFVALALVPVAAQLLDQPFYMLVAQRIMILAIAALSLNLLMGYGGMISFGHAVYVGLGAYAVGISAFYGVTNGAAQLAIVVGVSALVALVFGANSLRTRGVYFIMITLALAQMLFFLGVSLDVFGGDDGLNIDQRSTLFGLIDLNHRPSFYYLVFFALVTALYLCHRLVNSRFGMVIQGARSNEPRMQAIGFPTLRYRLTAFVIAGVMAGVAGALLANHTDFVSPDMMHWTHSGELIFMVLLGGMGSLAGPVVGAAIYLLLEELLSGWTVHWQLIFGPFLIAVVLFGRGGLLGLMEKGGPMAGRERDDG